MGAYCNFKFYIYIDIWDLQNNPKILSKQSAVIKVPTQQEAGWYFMYHLCQSLKYQRYPTPSSAYSM